MPPSSDDLQRALRELFGFPSFRPGQERVIRSLLAGRDVLAVLPTGAGKSLVYQLTAQLLPGITLVVSPLIALMQDQEEALEARGIAVGVVNSARSEQETDQDLDRVRHKEARLLYVTPERFDNAEFMAELAGARVDLLVVDEAHSISEWGHDFRPAYLGLGAVAKRLGRPTLLALTATATPWIRREIVERLGMKDPEIVVRGVDRPNLFFEAWRAESEADEERLLERLLHGDRAVEPYAAQPELADWLGRALGGPGIVYCATTRHARATAERLRGWGVAADFYHGRRTKADRQRVQDEFMAGRLRVIAATNAFGLGIDKPDIRFVIHRDVPASLEAYYQEAGRAGRDGQPARCVLLYRPADLGQAAFLAGGPAGEDEERQRAYEHSRIEMMRAYAELRDCRRRYILNYFGQEAEHERCGSCDNDVRLSAGHSVGTPPTTDLPFELNDRVRHRRWGVGIVQRVTGDTITVLFERVGYKTLDAALVRERCLLRKSA